MRAKVNTVSSWKLVFLYLSIQSTSHIFFGGVRSTGSWCTVWITWEIESVLEAMSKQPVVNNSCRAKEHQSSRALSETEPSAVEMFLTWASLVKVTDTVVAELRGESQQHAVLPNPEVKCSCRWCEVPCGWLWRKTLKLWQNVRRTLTIGPVQAINHRTRIIGATFP